MCSAHVSILSFMRNKLSRQPRICVALGIIATNICETDRLGGCQKKINLLETINYSYFNENQFIVESHVINISSASKYYHRYRGR